MPLPVPVITDINNTDTGALRPGMAPYTLFVSATGSTLSTGSWGLHRFQWDFGDLGAPYNTGLEGFSSAHHYTGTGIYTVTLTMTDATGGSANTTRTVQVTGSTRGVKYVTINGSDSNNGNSEDNGYATLTKALDAIGSSGNWEIVLQTGGTYGVAHSFGTRSKWYIHRSSPDSLVTVACSGAFLVPSSSTLSEDIVIEGLNFTTNTGSTKIIDGSSAPGNARWNNLSVINCKMESPKWGDCITQSYGTGLLVQNFETLSTGRGYTIFLNSSTNAPAYNTLIVGLSGVPFTGSTRHIRGHAKNLTVWNSNLKVTDNAAIRFDHNDFMYVGKTISNAIYSDTATVTAIGHYGWGTTSGLYSQNIVFDRCLMQSEMIDIGGLVSGLYFKSCVFDSLINRKMPVTVINQDDIGGLSDVRTTPIDIQFLKCTIVATGQGILIAMAMNSGNADGITYKGCIVAYSGTVPNAVSMYIHSDSYGTGQIAALHNNILPIRAGDIVGYNSLSSTGDTLQQINTRNWARDNREENITVDPSTAYAITSGSIVLTGTPPIPGVFASYNDVELSQAVSTWAVGAWDPPPEAGSSEIPITFMFYRGIRAFGPGIDRLIQEWEI